MVKLGPAIASPRSVLSGWVLVLVSMAASLRLFPSASPYYYYSNTEMALNTPTTEEQPLQLQQQQQQQPPKETAHVLYGLKGNNPSFLDEFGSSLKSALLNAPVQYDLNIHLVLDQEAFDAMPEFLHNKTVDTWNMHNQVTIHTYNVESHVEEWSKHLWNATGFSERSATRHTIGAYFRLFAGRVIKNTDHVIYLDTDAVFAADYGALWKIRDPNVVFQWGEIHCSGFTILNIKRIEEIWPIVNPANIHKTQDGTSNKPGDQLLMATVNQSRPDLVGYFPEEWDVTLSHLFRYRLTDVRPNGVGQLHLNGGGSGVGGNAFQKRRVVDPQSKPWQSEGWENAGYYDRMPWAYAKFIVESKTGGDNVYPVKIVPHDPA